MKTIFQFSSVLRGLPGSCLGAQVWLCGRTRQLTETIEEELL